VERRPRLVFLVQEARCALVKTDQCYSGLFPETGAIFRQFPDGWKIVHDHTSAEEPPKPKPG
ncbi:MAG TPA: hypothetical protein VKF17_15345, partial [Isosphaeraceae bacterium]|nr:hypothetical protein [Isosphaeraceae bacterium]